MKYIYKIENDVNDKVYIGQTTKSLEERWKQHLRQSKREDKNYPLYKAMKTYGTEHFHISLVEEVSDEISLDEREQYWINYYNSYGQPNGYNDTIGGNLFSKDINPAKLSEIKEKISVARRKNNEYWQSEAFRDKQRLKWLGDNNPSKTPENKKKISDRVKGDGNPSKDPKVKEKISLAMTGKHPSKETREKMSKNNGRYWKGKKLPQYIINAASKGRTEKCSGKNNPQSISVELINLVDNNILEFETVKSSKKYLKSLGFKNLAHKMGHEQIIGDYKIIYHKKCND